MAYSYRCKDYPGMEACPASFTAETENELWKHIELHGAHAHGEEPDKWSSEDRQQIKTLIRVSAVGAEASRCGPLVVAQLRRMTVAIWRKPCAAMTSFSITPQTL